MKGTLLIALSLCFGCVLFLSLPALAYHAGAESFATKEDTTKPVKAEAEAAAKKAAKEKEALTKKILSFFKFKKNTKQNQKELILETIRDMHIPDSIKTASLLVQLKLDTMNRDNNKRYNELSSLIDSLLKKRNSKDSSFSGSSSTEKQPNTKLPDDTVEIDHNMPGIKSSAELFDATDTKEKNKVVSLIKNISYYKRHPSEDSANTEMNKKLRTYQLMKSVDICGFYNDNSNFDYTQTDFSLITTLIYDSLFTIDRQGNIKKLRGELNEGLVTAAKASHCSIIYTILFSENEDVSSFLASVKARENFVTAITSLRKEEQADGINIHFKGLKAYDKDLFTSFIQQVVDLLGKDTSIFKIYLTLPAYDENHAYDIQTLSSFVTRFCIDFSSFLPSFPAPSAALAGNDTTTISSSLSYYLNQEVTSKKFMINLGYRGTKWLTRTSDEAAGSFIQYLSYGAIRDKRNATVLFDSVSSSVYIDELYPKPEDTVVIRTWFDDEKSLSAKYDFILQKDLGGIGFSYFGYDGQYSELWDELLYKFIQIDSVALAVHSLSPFEKWHRWMSLYNYILQHPCEPCFANFNADSLQHYIIDLGLDTSIDNANKIIDKNNKQYDTTINHYNVFSYLTKNMNDDFLYSSLFFLLLLLIFALAFVHFTKAQGDKWKHKKRTGWLLSFLAVIFLWSFFDYLFTSPLIPDFGVSDKSSVTASCRDPDCINMPLNTLLAIITVASLAGFLLTRYLLVPLLKKENVP